MNIFLSMFILHLIYFGILFLADEGNYLLVSNLECGLKNSNTKYRSNENRITTKSND